MTKELADAIRKNFTPFAFTCSCNGTDADCARALRDEATQIRYYAMLEIAAFIEKMEG